MKIISNDAIVKQILERITKTLSDSGAQIHPALCIHQSGQNFWVTCSPSAVGQNLLSIPSDLFIPVTKLQWQAKLGELLYSGNTASLSPIQQQLLDDMVLLYNQVDKVSFAANTMPSLQLKNDPLLNNWIPSVHNLFLFRNKNPAEQFVDTRVIELPSKDMNGALEKYLMPLIDLLDHHPYAPKFELTEDCWQIAVAFPIEQSDKCYVRYSKADSLSIAIWHGYFDPYTRHIASVDCKLQHPELGEVLIINTNAKRQKINAPRLMPSEAVLTLQDLVMEKDQLHALRTLLGLAIRSKRRDLKQSEAEFVANNLIEQLINVNIQKYSELLALCQTEPEHFPLRPLFGQVAEHQLALLEDLRAA